jgi:ribosomal-protein-alanine N-acetyltransferase
MRRAKPQLELRIETERLLLRPIVEGDLDDLVAEINDYDVAKMTARIPHPYAMSDAREYFVLQQSGRRRGDTVSLTVEHDGKLIGGISIFGMPCRAEIGYWFGRAQWGHGFATEAGRALLGYGFDALNLPLVHCRVALDNPASFRVQMKLGFRRIGFAVGRSLARGADVEHIHSILTPGRFRAVNLR